MSGTFNRMRFFGRRSSRKGRYAFTLVELLVVVAIIALLVSILLPMLNRAKVAAKLVICQTNMHAIGRAAYMYATENNDCVPRDASWYDPTQDPDKGVYFFAARFSPYLGGPVIPLNQDSDDEYLYDIFRNIGAYRCPSFQDKNYVLTYLTNGWNFTDPTKSWTPAYPLTNLKRAPAEVGYIMEINPFGELANPSREGIEFGKYDCLGYYNTTTKKIVNYHLTYNQDGTENIYGRMIRFDDDRHYGRTTLVFFDGHAESRWLNSDELPLDMFFVAP